MRMLNYQNNSIIEMRRPTGCLSYSLYLSNVGRLEERSSMNVTWCLVCPAKREKRENEFDGKRDKHNKHNTSLDLPFFSSFSFSFSHRRKEGPKYPKNQSSMWCWGRSICIASDQWQPATTSIHILNIILFHLLSCVIVHHFRCYVRLTHNAMRVPEQQIFFLLFGFALVWLFDRSRKHRILAHKAQV